MHSFDDAIEVFVDIASPRNSSTLRPIILLEFIYVKTVTFKLVYFSFI